MNELNKYAIVNTEDGTTVLVNASSANTAHSRYIHYFATQLKEDVDCTFLEAVETVQLDWDRNMEKDAITVTLVGLEI